MVFQAFVEESEDQSGTDIIVLAGYVATAEAWAAFSKEWAAMPPMASVIRITTFTSR